MKHEYKTQENNISICLSIYLLCICVSSSRSLSLPLYLHMRQLHSHICPSLHTLSPKHTNTHPPYLYPPLYVYTYKESISINNNKNLAHTLG